MTDVTIKDDWKSIITALGFGASVLLVFVYVILHIQSAFFGLPEERGVQTQQYAAVAVGIVTTLAISAVVIAALLNFLYGPMLSMLRRATQRIPQLRRFLADARTGSLRLFVLLTLIVFGSFAPASSLSLQAPFLWHKPSATYAYTWLFVDRPTDLRILFGGMACGVLVLAGVEATREFWMWRRDRSRAGVARLAFAAFMLLQAGMGYLVVLAATLPGPADLVPPKVTLQLRTSALAGATAIDGFLIERSGPTLMVLLDKGDGVRVLPRDSVAFFDFRDNDQTVGHLLGAKWGYQTMERKIIGLPFLQWFALGVGLFLIHLLVFIPPAAAEDPVTNSPEPAVAPPTQADTALVAMVLPYFANIADYAQQAAEMIYAFPGLILRGESMAGDLWLRDAAGEVTRLTVDGGYAFPRPSHDGTRIAYLRQGRLGVFDLDRRMAHAIPGDTSFLRLFGWDERTDTLLALSTDHVLVRVGIADGQLVVFDAVTPRGLAKLAVLAQLTPERRYLFAQKGTRSWAVMERAAGATRNTEIFRQSTPIADPAWSRRGIVYIGHD